MPQQTTPALETFADYESDAITSPDSLTDVYGEPWPEVAEKVTDHVDALTAAYISACSLAFLGSRSPDGRVDVTPRGGTPGFITVLNEKLLAIPDAPGNKRLDSMRNISETGRVGGLFLIPGRNDVVRINGRALVTQRADLLDRLVSDKPAKLALLIEPDEVFIHCPRALRRSNAWKPEEWLAGDIAPDMNELYAQHMLERRPV